jgi:hypothetical protein
VIVPVVLGLVAGMALLGACMASLMATAKKRFDDEGVSFGDLSDVVGR